MIVTVTTPAKVGTPEYEAARVATARSTLDALHSHLDRWRDDPDRLSEHLRRTGELVDRASEAVPGRLVLLHIAVHGPELLTAQRVLTGAQLADGICPRCWHQDCTGMACLSLSERQLRQRRAQAADVAASIAESHAAESRSERTR